MSYTPFPKDKYIPYIILISSARATGILGFVSVFCFVLSFSVESSFMLHTKDLINFWTSLLGHLL